MTNYVPATYIRYFNVFQKCSSFELVQSLSHAAVQNTYKRCRFRKCIQGHYHNFCCFLSAFLPVLSKRWIIMLKFRLENKSTIDNYTVVSSKYAPFHFQQKFLHKYFCLANKPPSPIRNLVNVTYACYIIQVLTLAHVTCRLHLYLHACSMHVSCNTWIWDIFHTCCTHST